jgi:hypothetical protein
VTHTLQPESQTKDRAAPAKNARHPADAECPKPAKR